jgi:hypothetical protein
MQGDQIGRIFVYWAILGRFWKITEVAKKLGYFFQGKSYA